MVIIRDKGVGFKFTASSGVGVTFGAGQGSNKSAAPGISDSKAAQLKKVSTIVYVLYVHKT